MENALGANSAVSDMGGGFCCQGAEVAAAENGGFGAIRLVEDVER